MIIEQTIDKLYQMKLFGMADSVKERISRPDHRDLVDSIKMLVKLDVVIDIHFHRLPFGKFIWQRRQRL